MGLQNMQKGLMAAVSAIAPLGSLLISRGDSDPELIALSDNVLDCMHLLALISNGLSMKKREQLRPNIQATHAKYLTKVPEGSSAWLYGGNLSEAARKCEMAKKVGEKLIKQKAAPQKSQGKPQQQKRAGGNAFGGKQNKRFRHASNWQDQQTRFTPKTFGYNHYPMVFPAPQQYHHKQTNKPQQFQHFHQQGGKQEQHAQQPRQDFQPRGTRK